MQTVRLQALIMFVALVAALALGLISLTAFFAASIVLTLVFRPEPAPRTVAPPGVGER